MLTPNGRFAPNANLCAAVLLQLARGPGCDASLRCRCLSMTDYHPESWNPMVAVCLRL